MCLDGSWVHGLKATWSGKLSDSLHAQQPFLSTTKLEEGIVGVDGDIKPGHDTAVFQNIARRRFEFSGALVCTSRQDHHLAKCG